MNALSMPAHYGLYAACALAGVSLTADACALMAAEDAVKALKQGQTRIDAALSELQPQAEQLKHIENRCDTHMHAADAKIDAARIENAEANASFDRRMREFIRIRTRKSKDELARMNKRIKDAEEYNDRLLKVLQDGRMAPRDGA